MSNYNKAEKLIIELKKKKSLTLDLSNTGINSNELQKLLDNFKDTFSKLETLNLNNNYITTLPSEIQKLQNLEKLYIGNNKMTEFKFCNSVKLYHINLQKNKITRLSGKIGKNLKIVNLSNNIISSIDCDLSKVKLVNLTGNSPKKFQKSQKSGEINGLKSLKLISPKTKKPVKNPTVKRIFDKIKKGTQGNFPPIKAKKDKRQKVNKENEILGIIVKKRTLSKSKTCKSLPKNKIKINTSRSTVAGYDVFENIAIKRSTRKLVKNQR